MQLWGRARVKNHRLVVLPPLCGTFALAGLVAAGLVGLGPSGIESTGAPRPISATARTDHVDAHQATALDENAVSVADVANASATPSELRPMPRPTTPLQRIASFSTFDPAQNEAEQSACLVEGANTGSGSTVLPDRPMLHLAALSMLSVAVSPTDPLRNAPKPAVSPEALDACLETDVCIDQYLWSLYERAPKVDTVKVEERIKVKVTNKGKTRTVVKTLTKYITQDFGWKDPKAAQKAGMSLKDYVIGGMDRGFKRKLYSALRAMDDAGLSPGITSGFRDNYRQELASGNKAAPDSSYHGGSRRGGYGRGLAADLVSVKGETRAERCAWSEILWKWIDTHEKELGIGRPYLDKDPPHVAPIDGKEYADKRGLAKARLAGLKRPSLSTPK
jgi:hypothetical protein